MESRDRQPSATARLLTSLVGVMVAAIVAFLVWLATLSTRVSVMEQALEIRTEASRRVEEANREALLRIEHERESNDARVRDDLRELRSRVFK